MVEFFLNGLVKRKKKKGVEEREMKCMRTDRRMKFSMFCSLLLLSHALSCLLSFPATECLHTPLSLCLGVSQRRSQVEP